MTSSEEPFISMFTGGPVETHSYLVGLPEGNLLVDAPEGAATHFHNKTIDMLVLTHAHFDHVMHATTEVLLADRSLFKRLGLNIEVEPVAATSYLKEGGGQVLLGRSFDVYEVPGHCPGSVCLYDSKSKVLYGGDVLFAGGVGRWDLPGGDREVLLSG